MRELKLAFHAPSTSGAYYEAYTKTSYFFALNLGPIELEDFERGIEQTIIHEVIHFVINKVAGPKVSRRFDRLAFRVANADEDLYCQLY